MKRKTILKRIAENGNLIQFYPFALNAKEVSYVWKKSQKQTLNMRSVSIELKDDEQRFSD